MIPNNRRYRLSYLLAVAIFITLSTLGAVAKTPKSETPGLPNFHQVTDGIYRGAAPTKEGLETLKKMKIHTIIDLRISPQLVKEEKKIAEDMGFEWLNIPMGAEAPTQKQVDEFLKTLAKAPKESVFVHCQHGADRTGCMIGIYRVQVQGWTFKDAWAEMRKYGFKFFLLDQKEAVHSRVKPRKAKA